MSGGGDDIDWFGDLDLESATDQVLIDDRSETPLDLPVHSLPIGSDWLVMGPDEEYLCFKIPEPGTSVPEPKTSAPKVQLDECYMNSRTELREKLMKTKVPKVDSLSIAALHLQPTGIRLYRCTNCGKPGHNRRTCK